MVDKKVKDAVLLRLLQAVGEIFPHIQPTPASKDFAAALREALWRIPEAFPEMVRWAVVVTRETREYEIFFLLPAAPCGDLSAFHRMQVVWEDGDQFFCRPNGQAYWQELPLIGFHGSGSYAIAVFREREQAETAAQNFLDDPANFLDSLPE